MSCLTLTLCVSVCVCVYCFGYKRFHTHTHERVITFTRGDASPTRERDRENRSLYNQIYWSHTYFSREHMHPSHMYHFARSSQLCAGTPKHTRSTLLRRARILFGPCCGVHATSALSVSV